MFISKQILPFVLGLAIPAGVRVAASSFTEPSSALAVSRLESPVAAYGEVAYTHAFNKRFEVQGYIAVKDLGLNTFVTAFIIDSAPFFFSGKTEERLATVPGNGGIATLVYTKASQLKGLRDFKGVQGPEKVEIFLGDEVVISWGIEPTTEGSLKGVGLWTS